MAKRQNIEDRFWAKVDRSGECWLWTAYRDKYGYGVMRGDGLTELAHRVSWRIHNGEIPAHTPHVLHRCDTPPCVNPEHLWLGDAAANAADRESKGRRTPASGSNNGARTRPERVARGERSGTAKATECLVRELRAAVEGGATVASLSRRTGLAETTISSIVHRLTWAHVE